MSQSIIAYRMSTAEPVEWLSVVWTADENGRVFDGTYLGARQADSLTDGTRGVVEIMVPEGIVAVDAADWGLYVKVLTVPEW